MKKKNISSEITAVLNDLQTEFRSACTINDFYSRLRALEGADDPSERLRELKELYDMFKMCKIPYETGKDNAYYRELVNTEYARGEDSRILTCDRFEEKMVKALYNQYRKFPLPEDYMEQIVDRLCGEDDRWAGDPLRLRILKQFIDKGNYLVYKPEGRSKEVIYQGEGHIKKYVKAKLGRAARNKEELLREVDDEVFAVLERASRDECKPKGTYGLLKMVDDLASGRFHPEGATKKGLYLFAMVYGMKYYPAGAAAQEAERKIYDLESNLFRDYYTNNLMRFITDAYRKSRFDYEDPSGQGINYKNFAEMVYLYYICRDDLSPQEKIIRSNEMILRLSQAGYHKGTSPKEDTVVFRGYFYGDSSGGIFSGKALDYTEEAFEKFIQEHYNCDTYGGEYVVKSPAKKEEEAEAAGKSQEKKIMEIKKGNLQLSTEQNTANRVYEELLKKLAWTVYEKMLPRKKEIQKKIQQLGPDPDPEAAEKIRREEAFQECRYGLWFVEADRLRQGDFKGILDEERRADEKKVSDFMDLLLGIDSYMDLAKTKALAETSPSTVTRTSLLVVYYYYYNISHIHDAMPNFEKLFADFRVGADEWLEKAFYQKVSGKNIFDVLLIFSCYARKYL